MAIVTGTVEAISTKYDKFGILVNDKWYDTKFKPSPTPDRGDVVEFDDGGKKYINRLKITGKGEASAEPSTYSTGGTTMKTAGFPVDPLARERSIIRQNSLSHAVQVCMNARQYDPSKPGSLMEMVRDVVSAAQEFEKYSAGDLDREEAEALRAKTAA